MTYDRLTEDLLRCNIQDGVYYRDSNNEVYILIEVMSANVNERLWFRYHPEIFVGYDNREILDKLKVTPTNDNLVQVFDFINGRRNHFYFTQEEWFNEKGSIEW